MNKKIIPHPPVGTVFDPTESGRYYNDEDQSLIKEKLKKYSELLKEENKMPIGWKVEIENSNNNNIKKR